MIETTIINVDKITKKLIHHPKNENNEAFNVLTLQIKSKEHGDINLKLFADDKKSLSIRKAK